MTDGAVFKIVRVALEIISMRLLTILAMAGSFLLACWAMSDPLWERMAMAGFFAVCVYYRALTGKGKRMKMTIKKSETTVMAMDRSAGKPIRQQSIQDTYGLGKPDRLNPMGFIGIHCFTDGDQKQSPTTNKSSGFKKRFY
jgi:hypothetical protein